MVDLDALSKGVAGSIEKALADAMSAAVARYEADGVAALPGTFRDDLLDVMSGAWGAAAMAGGKDTRSALGEMKADEQTLWESILQQFVEQYGAAKVQQVLDTTRKQIMAFIRDGVNEGLSVEAIAKNIRDAIPALSRLRANIIARTETHTAANYASIKVAQTATIPLVKEWVSVEDHRTRDFGEGDGVVDEYNHRSIDGQTVAMEQAFMVPTKYGGKEPLMFPGDPNGSPGNTINCRCVIAYRPAERGST